MNDRIVLIEAGERYLRHRLGSLEAELLAVDHPRLRTQEIQIDENSNAVLPFDVYFEDADFSSREMIIGNGVTEVNARPMFEALLKVGPALQIDFRGDLEDAPPVLQSIDLAGDRLVLELLSSRITIRLGERPHALLEITDRISCYAVRRGPLTRWVSDPTTEL